MEERKYVAFISYRHLPLDKAVARRLHTLLEKYTVPRALRKKIGNRSRLGLVFRDEEELGAAPHLPEKLCKALDNAQYLILICTPDTLKSEYVLLEIRHFLSTHDHSRILPVLVKGEPAESYPQEITWDEKAQKAYTPLAPDVRADSIPHTLKRLNTEYLRLVAGILDCNYDDLVQRNQRRRMRQVIAASCAVLSVALGFSGMLLMKNRQITQQKHQAQYQESRALAADAQEALDEGNIHSAIDLAVQALPKAGEEDRPYYAEAAGVLMRAMDIFTGTDSTVMLSPTVLEQMTDIESFCLSQDGSLAVTLDKYGTVNCFDTVTAQLRWSDILPSTELDAGYEPLVFFRQDQKAVICRFSNQLTCLEAETGTRLWERLAENQPAGFLIAEGGGSRIATVKSGYIYGTGKQEASLILFSDATGQDLLSIPFFSGDGIVSLTFDSFSNTRMPGGGDFSEDGKYFSAAYLTSENDEAILHLFTADLDAGQILNRYSQPVEDVLDVAGLEMREDALYLALEPDTGTQAVSLLKWDWHTGQLLWQVTTPEECDDGMFRMDIETCVDFWSTAVFAGRSNMLYAISMENGEILGKSQLPGQLVRMQAVSDRDLGISLSNGTYAIAWCSSLGIQTTLDALYQISASLGEHHEMHIHNGGVVQRYTDGSYVEISVSNREREGYVAVIPDDHPNRVVVQRPVSIEKPVEQTRISIPVEDVYCSDFSARFCDDGKLVIGPFYKQNPETMEYSYFYGVFDTANHTCIKTLEGPENIYRNTVWYLPDTSGYIAISDEGDITLWQDGQTEQLAVSVSTHNTVKQESQELQAALDSILAQFDDSLEHMQSSPEAMLEDLNSIHQALKASDSLLDAVDYEETDFSRYLVRGASAYRKDGSVLTVATGSKTMTLWTNGKDPRVISLPAALAPEDTDKNIYYRLLKAGGSGHILMDCRKWDDPTVLSGLNIYSMDTGSWTALKTEGQLPNEKALAMAEDAPLLALADDRNTLRVFSLETGEETASFSLQLPAQAVIFLDFLLDNTHLMAKTQDGSLFIFDISTGEMIFRESLGAGFRGGTVAWQDRENQRLYLIDSEMSYTNGLCIDLSSWTVLGTSSGMVTFDEASGELYHFRRDREGNAPLSCIRVPNTRELVALGQHILEAQKSS